MALLTAPVNQLTDYQLEYDGLLLGPGTAYDLPPDLDLLDLPGVRAQDTSRDPGFDGAFSGPDDAEVAVFDVPFELYAADDAAFAAAVATLRSVARIRREDAPLWFKVPGVPVLGIGAKVNRRSLPIQDGWSQRLSRGALQFRSVRPWLQSIARTVELIPASSSGGLRYPLYSTWGTDLGSTGNAYGDGAYGDGPYGGSSGPGGGNGALDYGITQPAPFSAALRNDGNSPAYPVVQVSGPSQGFALTLDGHQVASPLPLAAGDVLTLDYATGQAQLGAGAYRTGFLTARDFTPVPAESISTIVFTASGGSALVSTADIWRG